VTKLSDATSSTESLIEKFRYRTAADRVTNRTSLVAELSLYPSDPHMLARLGFPIRNFHERENLTQLPVVFVSAADAGYFFVDMDAIGRVQKFFPNHSIYFYDLSDGMLGDDVDKVSSAGARFTKYLTIYPKIILSLSYD